MVAILDCFHGYRRSKLCNVTFLGIYNHRPFTWQKVKKHNHFVQTLLPYRALKLTITQIKTHKRLKMNAFLDKSANFNSDIQLSFFSFSCFMSVCPFVALLKATYDAKMRALFCQVNIKKRSFLTPCVC